MGFDIECIVDIHMYPGEYFCPVCRTLVYPNEAVQAQCTHLYCKQCLSHIANSSMACPYDGYLVTEADSKPLVASDKVLAEKIGQVKVRCLFFRSGCTWEGAFSECNSHCAGCSFGNSPVVCNRCGMQIVHKQVHEHAQSCSGGHEAQPAVVGVVGAIGSSTSTAQASQTVLQQAGPLSHAPTVAPVAAAQTPDQWYQQQYQQYYQQYPGYQPYQQPLQQSYPVQQQPYQQYQQQQPAPVQVQNQSSAHSQAVPQPQAHIVPQIPQQSHFQMQAQGQGQVQPHTLVPPQGQAQVVNNHVNQQLPHPPVRPQAQLPPQSLPPPPHGQVAPYPHAMGVRPAAQHGQGSQYAQPPVHMHYPQPSQTHVQPQMHSQPQSQPPPLPQPGNQQHVQVQQAQPYQSQSQTYLRPPPPPSQSSGPTPPHSYQQPQPAQQMHPGYPHPSSAALNPGQVPQQPLVVRPPPPPVGSLSHQQPPMVVPSAHHQQFQPHVQQPPPPFQQHPAMMPAQQPVTQQYAQQQPFNAPFQVQSHQQVHIPPQPIRPNGPPLPQQSQYHTERPMMSNQSMHPPTMAQSSRETGTVPHSGPVQLGSKQTSLNHNNLESTRLERNTMEQAPKKEKGFDAEPINKEMTEAVESGDVAANDGFSVKQEVGTCRSVAKSSESGMHGSLKEEDLENRDMGLSKAVSGVTSSADPDKESHVAASGNKTEGSYGLAPKLHTSFQQRPEAFTSNSPSLHMPRGTGSREPGYFGPPSNNSESHSSNQGPSFARRDGKMMAVERERLDPFSVEPTQPPAHSLSYNGNLPHGQKHELNRMSNFGSGRGVGMHHMKYFDPRSTDREYLSITGHGFAEGSRSFYPSADPFHDGRFPPSSDHLPRGNIDGPGRFGDHIGPRLLNNHNRRGDFRPGGPDHLMREAFPGPDAFSGRDHMTEFHTGSLHGMRNRYPSQGLSNTFNFPGLAEPFDLSRKRRPMSTGWCRICKVDCETVEGLDMHSQTREHQNMAIDMVKTIKQQNKKKHRASMGHISHEIGRVHQ